MLPRIWVEDLALFSKLIRASHPNRHHAPVVKYLLAIFLHLLRRQGMMRRGF